MLHCALPMQYITVSSSWSQDHATLCRAYAMHYSLYSLELGPCYCNTLQSLFPGVRTMLHCVLPMHYVAVSIPWSQDHVTSCSAYAIHYSLYPLKSGPCYCNALQSLFPEVRTMLHCALPMQYITIYIPQSQDHVTRCPARAIQ